MNELEKRAKKHKRKQKYPMSIFPDYKKGAEEFNKNSTPINQDALSSADASSGMAEDIERNKKKGINEEMDDFLNWEIAEPQCTGYDCDDNIEYVYGDNENRVWIEQDGRKYKVFVNQVEEKPTATFTSLNKAKAFGEKYWQDNYGYIDESLSEEYIPDLTQRYPEGFDGDSPYRYEDDEYRAWDDYTRWYKEEEKRYEELKKNAKYRLIREWEDGTTEDEYFLTKQDAIKEADRICGIANRSRRFKDDNPLTYITLENIKTGKSKKVSIEDMLGYYNGTNQTNESLNETLEYNEDIKIDGFEFSEYENHHTGEMEVETYYNGDWVCSCDYDGWDGLRVVDENPHYSGIINRKDVEQFGVGTFYDYCLSLKDKFEERNRSAFDPMDESLKEGFSNGTLADFNPQDLMDKVKSRLEAINTVRTNGNMKYMISIHPHGLFARLSPETKYDVFIVSEDEDGNQEWVSSYEEFSNLLDTEVVSKLNDWKNNAVNVNESISRRGSNNANSRRYI